MLDQMDLTYAYTTFHSKAIEYTYFSFTHGTFSSIDHVLDHKTHLKSKTIEIISSIFSNNSGVKLEINYKKKTGKFTNMWRLNSMLLNNQWVEKKLKKYLETNENGNTIYQNLLDTVVAVLRGKFIWINPYMKKKENIKQPNFVSQGTRKRRN